MPHDIYRRLAGRLDDIPNGFAATESGVELELLAMLFTPEEAELACVMRLGPETPEVIGERAGVDGEAAAGMVMCSRASGPGDIMNTMSTNANSDLLRPNLKIPTYPGALMRRRDT